MKGTGVHASAAQDRAGDDAGDRGPAGVEELGRPPTGVDRADLRLALPALAAWLGAALASGSAVRPRLALTVAGAVLGAGGAVTATARRRGPAAAAVVLACAACFAGGLLSAAVVARARSAGPLAGLARQSANVELSAVISGDPTVSRSRAAGPGRSAELVLVPVSVRRVAADGRVWRVRQPVLLLVTATGSVWPDLLPSQRVDLAGRLAPARPGDTVTAVVYVRSAPSRVGPPSAVQRLAGRVRRGLRDAAAVLPRRERGLLPGLVLGDTTGLGDDVRDDFRAAGLTHVVAVSGENCAVILAVALAVGRRARLGIRSRAIWASLVLIGFVVLARPSPSVLRAAVMGLLGVVAAGAGRPRSTIPALSFAVLVLVLADPDLARSAGFMLSVLATAGLIVLAPGWGVALSRYLPPRLAEAVAIPLAAQVVCAPVIAAISGSVSTVAVIANLLALPAVPPATVVGLLAAVVAPVAPSAARVLAWIAGFPCGWLIWVAHVTARLPGARFGWPGGLRGAVLLTGATAIVIAAVRRRRPRRAVIAACVGALATHVTVIPRVAGGWPPPGWRMVACDVGQGDALVLSTGTDAPVLVDSGPDPAPLATCLRDLGVHRLTEVILTHLHADHVEGLPAVLGHLPVGSIEIGPLLEPPEEWARVSRWARTARVTIRAAWPDETGRVGTLSWRVLAPRTVLHGTDSDPNNNSLVIRAQTPDLSILLTGDAEPEEQAELRGRSDLRVDVLKVPHHGSGRQDFDLLAATGARVAVISVGAGNPYGHPSARTVEELSAARMDVFRTDLDGAVAVSRVNGAVVTTRQHRSATHGSTPTGPVVPLKPAAAVPAVMGDHRTLLAAARTTPTPDPGPVIAAQCATGPSGPRAARSPPVRGAARPRPARRVGGARRCLGHMTCSGV